MYDVILILLRKELNAVTLINVFLQEEEIPTTDSSNVEETDAQKHQMHRWNVKQECNEIDEQEQFRFLLYV